MTEIRQLFLVLAPGVFRDIAAERAIRDGSERLDACGPKGSLYFVGDDVRDRSSGRLATLPPDRLLALENYVFALHDRIAGYISPGGAHA